jgi:hypothetical protein
LTPAARGCSAAERISAFPARTAQNLNSGILPNGSSAGLVNGFAASRHQQGWFPDRPIRPTTVQRIRIFEQSKVDSLIRRIKGAHTENRSPFSTSEVLP